MAPRLCWISRRSSSSPSPSCRSELVRPCPISSSPREQRQGSLRAGVEHGAVDVVRAGQRQLVQRVEQVPKPDPVAVVAPGIVASVLRGAELGAVAAEAGAKGEMLDVVADHDRQPRAAGPFVGRALAELRRHSLGNEPAGCRGPGPASGQAGQAPRRRAGRPAPRPTGCGWPAPPVGGPPSTGEIVPPVPMAAILRRVHRTPWRLTGVRHRTGRIARFAAWTVNSPRHAVPTTG